LCKNYWHARSLAKKYLKSAAKKKKRKKRTNPVRSASRFQRAQHSLALIGIRQQGILPMYLLLPAPR
jgi:hypothetical protein